MHEYSVFGLSVRSEIELPELLPSGASGEADVTIRAGAVCVPPDIGPGLHPNGSSALLIVPRVANYHIHHGSRITVEMTPGVPGQNVRLYLLGSAFGALLHQRGLLPLHANSVEIDGKAVAFMGKSGTGKSTLAAWFNDRGHQVLSDDVCAVDLDDGKPWVRPGIGRLRLWREALVGSGRKVADYERSFLGEQSPDKYDVTLARSFAVDVRLPLGAVYVLERAEATEIERLTPAAAVDAVFSNTYRGGFVRLLGSSRDHWRSSVTVARTVPMFRAARRWGLEHLDAVAAEMLKHAEEVLGRD